MKKWFISICCGLSVLLAACGAEADFLLQNGDTLSEELVSGEVVTEPACSDNDTADANCVTGKIYVYICGAVKKPGVYEMEAGSRLYELAELAGGLSDEACDTGVNLAQHVEDGQMIRIPTEDEVNASPPNTAGSTELPASGRAGRVNINTADVAELTTLTGIGETKAASIIAYREKYGSFQHIEDIMNVDGIAKGTYEKINNMITVQ